MGEAAQAPGTPPARPRRRLLRFTALVAGATLLAGLCQATEATGSQAQSTTGSHTATMTLGALSPQIPAQGGSITVTGTVTNNSKSTITDAHVGVRIGPGPMTTRNAMKNATTRSGYTNAQDGNEIDGHTVDVPDLRAGRSTSFTLRVPVSALSLGASGVYQLSVTLDGQTAVEGWQHVLGIKRTFVPWYKAGESAKPTRIAYLWPLTDQPHMAARGDTDSQQSPIFLNDDLATELSPGNRLQQMVELAKDLPVTWVIDPDLVAEVDAMAKGYRVAGPGGDVTRTTPGTGSELAKQWLNSLRTAVAGDQVIALPFGDTDLASLAHQGKHVPGSVGHLKTAQALGISAIDTVLGVTTMKTMQGHKPTADVAWPVNGAIDSAIVSVARTGGAKRIIARNDTFPDGPLTYTPGAARSIGGGTTAVVADASLSTAFSGDMLHAQNADLAIQGFLAQTLLITMQTPQRQRTLLVAPERRPSVSQAQAMATAITATDASPWAATVSFDTAARTPPDPEANHRVPSAKSYPVSLRKHEMVTDAFKQIRRTQANLNDFVVILTRKDRVTVPFGNSVLRSMSTAWRGDPGKAQAFRDSIDGYLLDLIHAVHIIKKTSTLTLSGRSGTIPVTVKNELGQPVTGLLLRLTSIQRIRLEIHNAEQPISIEGGHTRTLKFQTTASANGPARLTAALYTSNGVPYSGSAIAFDVKITKVTDLVMLIIGVGLLLLVLAGVRIYRQRKRQAAAEGADDDSGGGGEDKGTGGGSGDDGEADDDGSGHPGDPAADTVRESPEPSPAGEKVDG